MAPNKILLLSLLLVPFCTHAQFGLGKKKTGTATILNTPPIGDYALHDPEYRFSVKLMDGYPDDKSAWIVYSDRDNNTTYQNPGNEKQPLASLDFMQACFVIGEKDDYVELAEYVPRVNMSKGKKTLEDPKYLGWVNKNTLLLWNRALKDKETNYFLKTITAFGTQRIFEILQHHVAGDSIITFTNPSLNQPAGKCGMENIFYIYKESVLGNEYLVGPDPSFLPENAMRSGAGWISKDLVRIWGTKGFVSVNPDLQATLPFYQSYPFIKDNQIDQDTILTVRSPYTTPKSDLEKLYPVVKYSTSKEGNVVINTNLLEDALDKGKNRVYNISGDLISNEDIETFHAKSSKLNIILVVSAGRKNGQYINNLQGVLETDAWQNAAKDNFREVNIGAVVYKDYGPGCDNAITPLTNDYRAIDEFLSEQRKAENDGCDDDSYYQGMYGGIIKAAKMLHDHSNESNIILVYGSGSDETPRKGEAIRSIQNVNARLLFFQTHNIPNEPAYISFVGDAKELIIKSAENITELKKRIIVPNTYPNILNGVAFTNDSTGRIQQLDYPKKAITQGFLLFPHDSENMPARYLADYLDSLITSVAVDNRTISYGLRSAVAQSGSGSTKIKTGFAYRFPKYLKEKIPLDFLKSNTLRDQNFLLPGWLLLQANDSRDLQPGLTAGVLLHEKEYADFANQLAMLGGYGSYDSKSAVVKQITDAVEKTRSMQNVKMDKPVKDLTFSEALGFVSGYFPVDPVWRRTTLSEYQSSDKISPEIGKAFLSECRNKAIWLHDHNNNTSLQIRNNGRIYYVINENHLPVNTVPDQQLPVANTVVAAPTGPGKRAAQDAGKDPAGDIGSVINDYNNNPAPARPSGNTAKETPEAVRTKSVMKKSRNTAGDPSQDGSATTGASGKKGGGNINKVNDDLGTAPAQENHTGKKESGNAGEAHNDTINYRKRITARQTEDGKNGQQEKSNAGLDKDPDQLDKNNTAAGTTSGEQDATSKVSIPKGHSGNADNMNEDLKALPTSKEHKKDKKQPEDADNDTTDYRSRIATQPAESKEKPKTQTPKRKQADLDKDLSDVKGTASQQEATKTGGRQPEPTHSATIKKGRKSNDMQDELSKMASGKGESRDSSQNRTDTVNYRSRISKQK